MEDQSTTASFGYWVKRRRLALDLTQAALARQVGCATVTIKKIEYDERRPSLQMAERLAECLALPAAERAPFIAAALHELPVDRLSLSHEPVAPVPVWLEERRQPPAESLFVSREREQAILDRALQQALNERSRLFFVAGEAGRGKTALLSHFAGRATGAHPDLLVAWGSCTAAGTGDPYLPFRDLLAHLVGDVESGWRSGRLSAEQASRLWEHAPEVVEIVRQSGPQLVDTLLPATSLRSGPAGRPARSTRKDSAAGQQDQLFSALTAVLEEAARLRPLLLVLDDLQWADSASLALLFHLGHRLQGSRILLLGAYRPIEGGDAGAGLTLADVVGELARRRGEIVVDLDQFDVAQVRRFVDAILDSEPNRLDDEFRVRFFWRTRGHPLFTVELLREMRARGDLVQDEQGRWQAGEMIDWETIPARVEAVIAGRLRRLPVELSDLLAIASVEGDSFTAQVVAALQGSDERAVFRQLARLQDEFGLVQEQGELASGERWLARYQFHHILFQQYVYQQLGQAERRHLHGAVAAALEALWDVDDESAELPAEGMMLSQLAHHFAEAGNDEKAAAYLIRLGDRARTLYANREAVAHYERALALMRKASPRKADREATGRLLMKLGLTHQSAFDYTRAQQAFDEAFSLMPERDPAWAKAGSSQAPRPLRMVWRDPPSLDPTRGGFNFTAPLANQLFSGLVAFGPENEILPDVAYRWEIEAHGRRYVFHLRDDVFWSDGRPVTAHDFAFTYRRALDPATDAPVASQLLFPVRGAREYHQGEHADAGRLGIRALDEHTFVLELEEATTYFIQNLAYYVMLPVPQHAVLAYGKEWAIPGRIVTDGPFRFAAWEPGKQMLLERNPLYHGSFGGNVEQVRLALGEAADNMVALYFAGELDVALDWFAAISQIDELRRRFPAEYVRRQGFATVFSFVNVTRAPFDNRWVRQALAMAVDRHALVEGPLQGYVTAATGGFVPAGMPGHLPDCALGYNPEEARRLLAQSSLSAGDRLTLVSIWSREQVSHFLQATWQRVLGIEVGLELATPEQFHEQLARPGANIGIGGWIADYPDPDNFLRVCIDVPTDVPESRRAEYSALLERAGRIADQAERLRLYQQADRILTEEAAIVPLYYQPFHLMLKPWVKRYPTAAVKNYGFWKDVVLEPEVGG